MEYWCYGTDRGTPKYLIKSAIHVTYQFLCVETLFFFKETNKYQFELQGLLALLHWTDTDQNYSLRYQIPPLSFSLFHRAFFNSNMYKTPTHALYVQHYIILTC